MYILSDEEVEWINENVTKYKDTKELYNAYHNKFGRFSYGSFMNARHQYHCTDKTKYTKEQEQFLIDNHSKYSLDELIIEFQKRFGGELKKKSALSMKCVELGLHKDTRKYNDERIIRIIEDNYNIKSREEICSLIKDSCGISLSEHMIHYIVRYYGLDVAEYVPRSKASNDVKEWLKENYALYPNVNSVRFTLNNLFGTDFSSKEIMDIANKQCKVKMCESKQFVKGQKPINALPVGTIREYDGKYFIKISDIPVQQSGDSWVNWMRLERYYYEMYHDIKLTSNDCIICLDNNPLNMSKENLVMISIGVHSSLCLYLKQNPEVLGNVELMRSLLKVLSIKSLVKKGSEL